ncbi:MAG: glycosyltransferase family 2 protein [Bacteroidota bacterium]|jgi:glycosyltransferase involved in cell wall biosynthesis
MEFSIIVPTYQEEGCIEKCLCSIAQQDYKRTEYEIIVSDAHSTDHTVEMAHQYADRVVIYDRRGIAYGRNAGAQSACGDILVFVDADVTLSSDFLFHCHQVFQSSTIVGMTGIAKPSDGGIMQRFVYRGTYCMVRIFHLFGVSLFPGICTVYRREAFKKIGGFREDFGIVEDLDLSRRISRLGICRINKNACAFVSTRRLEKHLLSTITFHIYSDIKYLLTGKASKYYPKVEEMNSWKDLWQNH